MEDLTENLPRNRRSTSIYVRAKGVPPKEKEASLFMAAAVNRNTARQCLRRHPIQQRPLHNCFTIALAARFSPTRGALHTMPNPAIFLVVILALYIFSCINILKEYERGVVFRLGRVKLAAAGPGVVLIFRPLDQLVRVSLRQEAMEVPAQDVITRDNVTLKVNAVITLRVVDPTKAVIEVSNYVYQTSQFAQTTLRSVLGEVDLDGLLAHREQLNQRIQAIIDGHTSPFGVKVVSVEVKQVDMPENMLRAMAKQAEAERERRAKIIHAEGEFNAAAKLVEAAALMATQPMTLQLRYLQTLTEIGVEKNTTIVFPLPMELINLFNKTFVPAEAQKPDASKLKE